MKDNLEKLKGCPFCGGKVIWCDSKPDEDGDYHQCDHINCTECKMDYVLTSGESRQAESIIKAKKIMVDAFNKRAG